jgi:hypothetical protein
VQTADQQAVVSRFTASAVFAALLSALARRTDCLDATHGDRFFVSTAEFVDDPHLRRRHSGGRSHSVGQLGERALRSRRQSQNHEEGRT